MSKEPGLFEIFYSCRAMRRLQPDPVPRELLLKLVDAANQAPSGSNLQNMRWIIVQDPEQKKKVADRPACAEYRRIAARRPRTRWTRQRRSRSCAKTAPMPRSWSRTARSATRA
jgi:nitroreductase